MLKYWRTAARVLVPALLLPLWSCGDDKTIIQQGGGGPIVPSDIPINPTLPEPTSGSPRFEAGPLVVEVEHIVGETPCPQLLKKILFKNTDQDVLRIKLLEQRPPLEVVPENGTVAPGGTLEISIFFDCTVRGEFTKNLTFEVENVRTGVKSEFKVSVTVNFK